MLSWVILVVGCVFWQRQGDGDDPSYRYMNEGERFFMQRADPEKLDRAISSWQQGLVEAPESIELLGRLARAYTIRGVYDPEDRIDDYLRAREHGLRCLQTDTFLAGVAQTYGGRLIPRALRTVELELIECLTWTSIAWSRWLLEHGVAGATLDLEIVLALATKAVELDSEHDRGRPMYALGLALSLPPAPLEPDLSAAAEALQAAHKAAPERWWIEVDLAERVYAETGQDDAFTALLSDITQRTPDRHPQELLENKSAIVRAEALLAAGPQPSWQP